MGTSNAATFNSDSEVVILGWDPADTHSNNFWTELASTSWTSGSSIDTGTFTAKKYLWIQISLTTTNANFNQLFFNNDTQTNYSLRYSTNGGADGTDVNVPYGWYTALDDGGSSVHRSVFSNIFMINTSSKEKLGISHSAWVNGTQTGAGYAPNRVESVGKWTNTSSQITSVRVSNVVGNNYNGGQIKVWGSD